MNIKRWFWSIALVAFMTLMAGLASGDMIVPPVSHGSSVDLSARRSTSFLTGSPSYSTIQGKASLDGRTGEPVFGLTVRTASAAALTTVDAFVQGIRIGSLQLDDAGAGNLELRVRPGMAFPRTNGAALIELRTPEGALVASGLLD